MLYQSAIVTSTGRSSSKSNRNMKLAFVFLLVQICCISLTFAYPSGAPTSVCGTLTPFHQNNQPQLTQSPYRVTATRTGDKVRVRISGGNRDFRGFVLQARYARDPERMAEGKFSSQEGLSQAIDCHRGRQNTLTQVNRNEKGEITTDWTPNSDVNGEVLFRAAVVRTFQEFWINIDSSPVRVSGNVERHDKESNLDSQQMYDGCYVSKGCLGYPKDCYSRRNCEVLVSYVNTGEGITFTMTGSLGSSRNYMASGLSTDNKMGDDSVTECFMDNGRVMAQNSWNTRSKDNQPIALKPDGMYKWQFKDGLASCTWTQPYIATNEGSSERRVLNLGNTPYYLLIAKGPMRGGRVDYHTGRLSSPDRVNFTAYEMLEGDRAHNAVKIHGTFMITGWVAFVSLAILMARHFKNDWENQLVCGVKIWFAVHRGLMIAALAFIVVAFIVIFVHKEGWNYQTRNPHAVLGCIATALGLFQPIMAVFRPSPDDKKRPLFNWSHWAVGNTAQILAIVAIFFAPSFEDSGLKGSFYWVMGVFVVIHCLFHLVFQFHAWSQNKKDNNEIKMHTMGSGRVTNSSSAEQTKSLAAGVVRGLLLGIYGIFLTVVMLALYALIGTA